MLSLIKPRKNPDHFLIHIGPKDITNNACSPKGIVDSVIELENHLT